MKKIPDHAKKVFEGVIFDVYHWDQEMFDGSTAVFEAIRKRSAVFVLAVSESKILINHEEQPTRAPFLSLPGGLCDKGEHDHLLSAQRELLEETGYVSEDVVHWFGIQQFDHPKIDGTIDFYIAKNCKKVAEPTLDQGGEKIDTQLVSFDEFLELRSNPMFRLEGLLPLLEKAATDETEKQTLQDLLGITT